MMDNGFASLYQEREMPGFDYQALRRNVVATVSRPRQFFFLAPSSIDRKKYTPL
jgi:hypothetical protein